MPVTVISNIKQQNDADFKVVAASDIDWDIGAEQTIATGSITQPEDGAYFPVDTASDDATDDLDTITTASKATNLILIHPANDARTIVVKHDTGNISCVGQADITLNDIEDICMLFFDSGVSKWYAMPFGGGAGHAESHTIISHSTSPQFSDVVSFVTATDVLTLVSGVIELPAAPFGLISVTSQAGADDDLVDIEINGGGTTLVPGTLIALTNTTGDAITLKHLNGKLLLSLDTDVVLNNANGGIDIIVLQALTNGIWSEWDRSPSLMPVASLTVQGKVELANTSEIDTGSDSTRAMPVDQFVASARNIRFITIRLVEAATAVAVGSIGGDWVCPFTGTLIQLDSDKNFLSANTDTAGTTGTMIVDIHKGGVTVMDTNKLDIETTEKSTNTATTQPDLTTTAVTAGDVFTFDVDAKHTTAALGLSVTFAIRMT